MINISRSFLIVLARMIPVVLVVGLSVVWSQEKGLRLQFQNKVEYISEKLSRTERVNTELKQELEVSKQTAERIKEEKLQLISQLGERDEHIRRLLSEMVRILSGSNAIDLGRLTIRGKEEVWDGVNKELKNVANVPVVNNFAQTRIPEPANHLKLPPIQPMNIRLGSPQVQIEERVLPSIPPVNAVNPAERELAPLKDMNIQVKERTSEKTQKPMQIIGEVLVVNREHNFVVLNRGVEHSLREGDLLQIYRDDKRLGSVQIETAYQKISAATVIEGFVEDFKTGDGVVGA